MTDADSATVGALLTRGFASWRDADFWTRALRRLSERTVPAGLPRMGYVLEASGTVVGVLLLIASEWTRNGATERRCNVSSWYVEPAFRLYGTLLVRQALRHRDVTYLNVTPAPETWTLLAAQGYVRYAAGRSVLLPLLGRGGGRMVEFNDPRLDAAEAQLLREHAQWGCLTFVVETGSGLAPFVFGLRKRAGVLPFAYLLYSRGLHTLTQCARPLGRALARRGIFVIVADCDEKVPGMPGWFEGNHPKFYRGPTAPDPGDLAYTERAVFGV